MSGGTDMFFIPSMETEVPLLAVVVFPMKIAAIIHIHQVLYQMHWEHDHGVHWFVHHASKLNSLCCPSMPAIGLIPVSSILLSGRSVLVGGGGGCGL